MPTVTVIKVSGKNDYVDYVSSIVARGHGTICCGNGRMVHYGKEPPHKAHGMAWISNEIHDEEAECLIREAIHELREDARRASKTRDKRELIISEADA
jgi:hypothetical protein